MLTGMLQICSRRSPLIHQSLSLQALLQKAIDVARQKICVTSGVIKRSVHEKMRRPHNGEDANVVIGLLERPDEWFGLRLPVNYVVFRTPANKERWPVNIRGDPGKRRRIEVSEFVIYRADAKVLLADVVTRTRDDVVLPLGEHVIDGADRHDRLHSRTCGDERIVRVASAEGLAMSCDRDQR